VDAAVPQRAGVARLKAREMRVDIRSVDDFRNACRQGDTAGVELYLERNGDAAVTELVERIGGEGPMAWFLDQRRHVLDLGETPSLEAWLRAQLWQADPMHLLDVEALLPIAEQGDQPEIPRRLKGHLQFVQPPDPTRWSRKFNTPAQIAYLHACAAADSEQARASIAADATVVETADKWGRDGLALIAAQRSEQAPEIAAALCEAGVRKTAAALVSAASSGNAAMLDALLALEVPPIGPCDEDALWAAAAATGHGALADADFAAIAPKLVAAGAKPDCSNRWGTSAWGVASAAARTVLEGLGAKALAQGPARYDPVSGCSAIIDAVAGGEQPDDEAELDLNEAAAAGDIDRVRTLLEEVLVVKPVIRGRCSPERPLHLAAHFGCDEVAQLLMDHGYSPGEVNVAFDSGAYVGPKETWDQTVLAVAVARSDVKMVDILMNTVDFFQGRRARRK